MGFLPPNLECHDFVGNFLQMSKMDGGYHTMWSVGVTEVMEASSIERE